MISKNGLILFAGILLTSFLFLLVLLVGAVKIPVSDVFSSLTGGATSSSYYSTIVLQTRLPMAIGAICCGSLLSVAGLMMQTVFNNPLAGPSVLGISSGASLGVAFFMLGISNATSLLPISFQPVISIISALIGGLATIFVLIAFSSILRSGVTLLIVGLMISYLCTSVISLLNYFSPAEGIRNYLVWGLGSFSGLRLSSSLWLAGISVFVTIPAVLYLKPLNAMLLGQRYLESVGYSSKKSRTGILIITGCLVAIPTAFCGPIGFIGLIVPHFCRLLFKSSNHLILFPASIVYGALVSLGCAFIGVLPSSTFGVLPINVITPIIGVPVILYLLVNRYRLPYFS